MVSKFQFHFPRSAGRNGQRGRLAEGMGTVPVLVVTLISPVFGADYNALADGLFGMGSLQASTA